MYLPVIKIENGYNLSIELFGALHYDMAEFWIIYLKLNIYLIIVNINTKQTDKGKGNYPKGYHAGFSSYYRSPLHTSVRMDLQRLLI